jgi:hypothetical protein
LPGTIAIDSGPLYALIDRRDADHEAAKAFFARETRATLVVTLAVLVEVAIMLQPSSTTQARFIRRASTSLTIDQGLAGDLPRIAELLEKYADLPADFADASLIALCERRGIASIATLDRDFAVYRLPRNRLFKNVFFGAAG